MSDDEKRRLDDLRAKTDRSAEEQQELDGLEAKAKSESEDEDSDEDEDDEE